LDDYASFYGGDGWFDGGPSVHHLCDPLGSGGGGGDDGEGGSGGGAIRLTADEIVIDGLVSARGGPGTCEDATSPWDVHSGGGGAGGLVELRTEMLSGSGVIDASGGRVCEESLAFAGAGGGGWVVLQSAPPVGLMIEVNAGEGVQAEPGRVSVDGDGDGLGEDEELALGLDPENPDTDGDGTDDGTQSIVVCTNPI
jgi:hypothetical protein